MANNNFHHLKQVARWGFSTSGKIVEVILELFNFDVCGPMQTTTFGGIKYFITFIDDYFRFITIFF
jgi:hypothetical protein